MVVNAARAHRTLTANQRLATGPEMLEKVKLPGIDWKQRVESHQGLSLPEIPIALGAALRFYGVTEFQIEAVPMQDSAAARTRLHRDLVENEATDRNFIIANFDQGLFTGDAPVGHISPVAAYDARRKRVLVLDSDREWYEPYWVSEATFARGMLNGRGYVKVRVVR
jgi:hypothetical protein